MDIAYLSQRLKPRQVNYLVHDLESGFCSDGGKEMAMKFLSLVYKIVRLSIFEHSVVCAYVVLWLSCLEHIRACQCDDVHLNVLRDVVCRVVLRRWSLVYRHFTTLRSDLCFKFLWFGGDNH